MKKIKQILVLILAIVIGLSFTGCVIETHTVNISSDGGSAKLEQILPKDVYNELISMDSNFDSYQKEGYEIEHFYQDGTECVRATKSFKFKNLDEIERYFEELGTSNEGGNSEKYFKSFDIKSKGKKITISGEIGKPDAMTAYTSLKIILKFDNKISGYTIGEIKDDNTIELDMLELWKNHPNEQFTIKTGGLPFNVWYLIIGIAFAVIIVITVIFIVKKVKRK